MFPLIGVLHLEALPGTPFHKSMEYVMENAILDSKSLAEGGVDSLIIENYGDRPFLVEVGKEIVSTMTAIAIEVKKTTGLPIGINVLRNDAIAALSIALAIDADFVRVNQLMYAALSPEGWMKGDAGNVMKFRKNIGCRAKVFCDVEVKHAHHFVSLEEYLNNLERVSVDGVIITGETTSSPVSVDDLKLAKKISSVPVIAGSGVNRENVHKIMQYADAVIVGTYFKKDGRVDAERVREVVKSLKNF